MLRGDTMIMIMTELTKKIKDVRTASTQLSLKAVEPEIIELISLFEIKYGFKPNRDLDLMLNYAIRSDEIERIKIALEAK